MMSRILLLITILVLTSCKESNREIEFQIPIPKFDFSKIENNHFPKPIGIVNDYNQIFTTEQRNELSKILYEYETQTKRQIVVVTVDSLSPYDSGLVYARDLLYEWDSIFIDKNIELVIVLCIPEVKMGIASDSKTGTSLSYETCYGIYDKTMVPEFENNEFYNGTKKGIEELIVNW